MPAEPWRRAPGAVADVDGALRGGLDDPLDPGDGPRVQIARQHLRDPDPALEPGIELRPGALRPDREDVVDPERLGEALDRLRAQELILRERHGGSAPLPERLGPPQHAVERWRVPALGEEGGVKDDRVEPHPAKPPGSPPDGEVQVEAAGPGVVLEGFKRIADRLPRGVLHEAVDHQDVLHAGAIGRWHRPGRRRPASPRSSSRPAGRSP